MLNEFLAYLELAAAAAPTRCRERSRLIMLYALCGFANFGSLGIMVAGLNMMAPERRAEIVSLGLKSIVSGTLATCLIGAVVGVAERNASTARQMQLELAADRLDLGRRDQARMRDLDRMQRAVERLRPEVEKLLQHRKFRAEIVLLPDVGLQQPGMIRTAIENVRGGQPVAFKLAAEIFVSAIDGPRFDAGPSGPVRQTRPGPKRPS